MSRLICPVCGEDAEPGRPRGGDGRGWSLGVQPERLAHRHSDREPLCPVMTSQGYQPALPKRARG